MSDENKKSRIKVVLDRTKTARTNLELEDGSSKGTSLAQNLSDSWSSPKAEDYEIEISGIVTNLSNSWDTLEETLQTAHDNA